MADSAATSTAQLSWLELATLPQLRLKSSDTYTDKMMMHFILDAYAAQEDITRNWKAQELATSLRTEDLASLADEVLQRWLKEGADAKKKWVLAFAAVYGDERVVHAIQAKITAWPLESRSAIACEAVKALLLSPLDSALLFIDKISHKFKFKQVKQAAVDALAQAAEIAGISTEELADRVVSHLGFDAKGCRAVNYGSRQFILQLMPNHNIRIIDENGKLYKTLPAPNATDDSKLAKASLLEVKHVKKQLKTTIESIRIRLEHSFTTRRRWNYTAWQKLFVGNPVLFGFASGLVWGVYVDETLITSLYGWVKGSIVDSGVYYEFYKEFKSLNIGVQLAFSGISVGMEDESVTVYEMEFYRAGKVVRGSYIYSEIIDEDRIWPFDVPKFLFSELLFEVDSVLAKRIGFDEDWRLNRS
ncbi:DUF4132 domain-containing protein [Paenibacillus pasadenensis]|uniref:DUF4132 domain-containing protein n=1 Tax=Paenibacillus pasadenensis TaxID=217090 RepID=UPI00203D5E07|nr:DUF4132 domain-containing protein [Paenibacillus pasadenensis]MCM3748861.1 DUF4132 domain-containing protein [Paenibacillus pasadenensis]